MYDLIPNPSATDTLAILRLYLEKYDNLAEEDRRVYRRVVTVLVNPPLVMDVGNGATDDDRKAEAAQADGSQSLADYEAQVKRFHPDAKLAGYAYDKFRVEELRGCTHVVLGDMSFLGSMAERRENAWKSAAERLATRKVAK